MIKINDYATKNHFNEWEIKDLPESDVYRLNLPNGDLSILFYLTNIKQLHQSKIFIPSFPNNNTIIDNLGNLFYTGFGRVGCPRIYTLDNSSCTETGVVQDITPDWSKYIAKDNAVLFLSEEDRIRFIYEKTIFDNSYDLDTFYKIGKLLMNKPKKISIILPSIHSENIEKIRNIAKDLKENYGVEYIEVIATHRFIRNFWNEVKILKTKEEIRNEAIKKIKNRLSFNLTIDIINGDKSDFILAAKRSNKSAEEIFDVIAKGQPEIVEKQIVCEVELIDKFKTVKDIDRLITTDSTGVIKTGDYPNSKVIDCEEFFTNFLQNDKS